MVQQASMRAPIRTPAAEVMVRKGKISTSVWLRSGADRGNPGEPALPWRKVFVSLPPGVRSVTAKVEELSRIHLLDEARIAPAQPNVPTLLGRSLRRVGEDRRVYDSDAEWPPVAHRVVAVRRLGGFAIAEVEVCPFRYRPRSGALDLVTEAELVLSFARTELKRAQARSVGELRLEARLGERVRAMVVNPGEVEAHGRLDHRYIPDDLFLLPEVPHVIVTTSALAPSLQRLANWRSTLGLASRVVTIEDIMAGTVPDTGGHTFFEASGYADGGTRDAAEALRSFLKWAAASWSTEYVVLGGDTDAIPFRQAIHDGVGTVVYRDLQAPCEGRHGRIRFWATASTSQEGSGPDRVQDEDDATAWLCAPTDAAPWLCLDLARRTPINRLDLSWGASHASSYVVEASNDMLAWTKLHEATAAPGGAEKISFPTRSSRYLRLRITSGAGFALARARVLGPDHSEYGGVAYCIDATTTRIYLSRSVGLNPTGDPDGDVLLFHEGPGRGTIIPYDPSCSGTQLGWRFIQDLVDPSPAVSAAATGYIEIKGPAAHHGLPFLLKGAVNYIPTDLYFSDVAPLEYPAGTNHDWDANQNGIYGERYCGELDQVNGLADIRTGRLPVSTAAEADVVVDKIIRYELYSRRDELGFDVMLPDDFATSVLLGAQNWFDPAEGELDETAKGKEGIRHALRAVDPGRWTFVRLYEDKADVPAADVGSDLDVASTAKILDTIRHGANVVALTSHGSSGYLCYMVSDDVNALTNTPGVWYANACLTNEFDVADGDCLGERSLLNPKGGAVAYMGNSRFGWTGDNPVELAFWTEMTSSARLGQMLDAARAAAWDWTKYSMNLLGDPAMRVWSDRPKQITVAHPAEICTGKKDVTVTVTAGGAPVAGAVVCLSIPGALHRTGETDASGSATIQVATSAAATMRVGVSGKNLIPHLGTLSVKACEDVFCKPAVTCAGSVTCGHKIGCSSLVTCAGSIVCGSKLTCVQALSCSKLLSCGVEIVCKGSIHSCPKPVGGCLAHLGGCMRLRPGEERLPDSLLTLLGIPDVDELARRLHAPEVREVLDRLPPEIARPVRMMAERIRKEDGLDD